MSLRHVAPYGAALPIGLLLLPLAVAPAIAIEDHGIGPAAGEVRTSLGSPWDEGAFYAGSLAGVYRLPAGGPAWEYAGEGLPDATVVSLAAGDSPGTLLAGVVGYPTGYGVYRTTDDGASWQARNTGLGNLTVNALASDPSTPELFYAATESGIYRSVTGGDLWEARGLGGKSVRDVRVDPSNPLRAWASVAFEGIYRTTNQGASWDLASNGIGGSKLFYDVKASADGQVVYAVGWDPYRSTNGGDSWTEMGVGSLPPFGTFNEMEIVGDPTDIVLVELGSGIWRSTDAGDSWSQIAPSTPDLVEFETICRDRFAPARLLAGALGGEVYLTQDLGADGWMPLTRGISNSIVLSSAVRGGRWIAGTIRGVYVSEDFGRTWGKSDFVYDIGAEINSLAIDPLNPLTIFCGSTNAFFKGDVWLSTDGGWHWEIAKTGDGPVQAVAIDPLNPQRVYAGYSCDVIPGGVYRTTDGGTTWITEPLGDVCVFALHHDPGNPANLLAGTTNGVYRSSDFGDTWSPRGPAGVTVVDLSHDAAIANRFYAATYGSRAYRSTDGGVSWAPLGGVELPAFLYAIEGRDATLGVLAGTETAGIWRLAGNVWTQLSEEDQPRVRDIRSLLALPDLRRVLAGTWGAGTWEYMSDPASAPDLLPHAAAGLQVLGSPSRGPFTMRLTLHRAGPVLFEIADVAGRRVRTIRLSLQPAGTVEAVWDGRDDAGRPLPAGIYLASARHDQGVARAKLCILR